MAVESPGGALFLTTNNDVMDPLGTDVIAHPDVIAEADQYVLRTPKMGPITPPPGVIQLATNAVSPVPVYLPAN